MSKSKQVAPDYKAIAKDKAEIYARYTDVYNKHLEALENIKRDLECAKLNLDSAKSELLTAASKIEVAIDGKLLFYGELKYPDGYTPVIVEIAYDTGEAGWMLNRKEEDYGPLMPVVTTHKVIM